METMMGAANPLTMMNKLTDQNMAFWNMFNPAPKQEGDKE
jgi:hypothetical protein